VKFLEVAQQTARSPSGRPVAVWTPRRLACLCRGRSDALAATQQSAGTCAGRLPVCFSCGQFLSCAAVPPSTWLRMERSPLWCATTARGWLRCASALPPLPALAVVLPSMTDCPPLAVRPPRRHERGAHVYRPPPLAGRLCWRRCPARRVSLHRRPPSPPGRHGRHGAEGTAPSVRAHRWATLATRRRGRPGARSLSRRALAVP